MEIYEINSISREITAEVPKYLLAFNNAKSNNENHFNENAIVKIEHSLYKEKPKHKINGAKTSNSNLQLISGRSVIKHIYDSIRKSPNYPKYFKTIKNGKSKQNINNYELLDELRKVIPGEWKKVYLDGYDQEQSRISIHYFEHVKTGKVFDVKVKSGWSNR